MKYLFCILLTLSFSTFSYTTSHGKNVKDSAILVLSSLSNDYTKGKLSKLAYLDTVHATMKSFLSSNITFENKETLQLLKLFRTITWSNKEYETHKRTYYSILCNQSQMAGREGEMLYYLKKINDYEQTGTAQPSITALSLLTQYYNSKNSYNNTKDIYTKNKEFILNIPEKADKGKMEIAAIVQSAIFLFNICDAFYQLDDTISGYKVELSIRKLAFIAKNKYKADNECMAHIKLREALATYRRGMSTKNNAIIQEAFACFDQLIADKNTPEYLKQPIRMAASEYRLNYFIKEKQIDSTQYYLQQYDSIAIMLSMPYNIYYKAKSKAQAFYNQGLYKVSADTLLFALDALDSSNATVVKDINDMMYARADAEEQQILLADAENKRRKTERQLSLIGSALAALLIGGLLTVRYTRKRQKAKFLNFKLNLARNIHDETNPALLYAKALIKSSRSDNTNAQADIELESHINHTMELIRSLSHDLKSDNQYILNDLVIKIEHTLKKLNLGNEFTFSIHEKVEKKRFISHYQFSQLTAILNECITNTIKHAEFNKINIAFANTGNKLSITYKDNGKGWQTQQPIIGIGIKNIEDRVKQINGGLKIENAYPDGYKINIISPLR